jgi:hypothetical protein
VILRVFTKTLVITGDSWCAGRDLNPEPVD